MMDSIAVISNEEHVVELINIISIEPKNQQHIVDKVQEILKKFGDKQPGFISAKVYKSIDGTRIVYFIRWSSIDNGSAWLKYINEILKVSMTEIKNADYLLYEVVYNI